MDVDVETENGADATDGRLSFSSGRGELESRERDSNDRLLSTTEASSRSAKNGTPETCVNDARGAAGGHVTDASAIDSREPNCNGDLFSPEERRLRMEAADDGVGGPGTKAPAALGAIDNSRRRAEVSHNGEVAETERPLIEAPLRSKLSGSHGCLAPTSPGRVPSPETSPASSGESTGAVGVGDDREQDGGDEVGDEVASAAGTGSDEAMGADDFLPLFALVLVSCVECRGAEGCNFHG